MKTLTMLRGALLATALGFFLSAGAASAQQEQQAGQFGQQPQFQPQMTLGQLQQQYPQQFAFVQQRLQGAQRLRQSLQQAGLQNIHVADSIYVIRGQTPTGETVSIIVSPPGGEFGAFALARGPEGQMGAFSQQQ